mmetsp:Transcript_25022/g.59474  ORF Transcript_25022/g.59474 Transcript_25022/m.59474 type:complete len:311 (+) Transcript_25022:165-1097(+)|eukprot:CAMPEP_0113466198 /NCGR_PEP_ID=MMETSP0014_2-20120614/14143_1 /TAXON_ID=2857 /ORGANISM="Nitzschia sp." /LENGTH=310 /DNA_ID=CAMNT_0000358403 /DNA_START=165 /DNA_END=1097 /DNA_ORIENTATION=+ /assembly_acc=CAM_ASM_000159
MTSSTTTTTTGGGGSPLSVGFIGCGMMASALMEGLVNENVVLDASSITCSDVYGPSRDRASSKGFTSTKSNIEVCQSSKDAVVIAVKPNVVDDVLRDIASAHPTTTNTTTTTTTTTDTLSPPLVISIAAGVQLSTLEQQLPGRRVVRVMPNTPCLVGEAASGYALGTLCNDNDRTIVETIFGAVGIAKEIKEVLLNAVTGLSGSGPAYVYQFIEALADGGVRSGLPRDVAMQLAAQTVKGAAEMVLQTGEHPGRLKDNVTSPGGTTIAGVEALEHGGFRSATISAVKAATRRSMQLGDIPEEDIRRKYNL